MNSSKIIFIILFALLSFSKNVSAQKNESERHHLLMDFNWKFQLGDQNDAEQSLI